MTLEQALILEPVFGLGFVAGWFTRIFVNWLFREKQSGGGDSK